MALGMLDMLKSVRPEYPEAEPLYNVEIILILDRRGLFSRDESRWWGEVFLEGLSVIKDSFFKKKWFLCEDGILVEDHLKDLSTRTFTLKVNLSVAQKFVTMQEYMRLSVLRHSAIPAPFEVSDDPPEGVPLSCSEGDIPKRYQDVLLGFEKHGGAHGSQVSGRFYIKQFREKWQEKASRSQA